MGVSVCNKTSYRWVGDCVRWVGDCGYVERLCLIQREQGCFVLYIYRELSLWSLCSCWANLPDLFFFILALFILCATSIFLPTLLRAPSITLTIHPLSGSFYLSNSLPFYELYLLLSRYLNYPTIDPFSHPFYLFNSYRFLWLPSPNTFKSSLFSW